MRNYKKEKAKKQRDQFIYDLVMRELSKPKIVPLYDVRDEKGKVLYHRIRMEDIPEFKKGMKLLRVN